MTWNYLGTLCDCGDASALGYLVFTGSSLVKEGGRFFLLLTPSGAKGLFRKNRAHNENNTHGGMLFAQINTYATPEFFQRFSTMQWLAR